MFLALTILSGLATPVDGDNVRIGPDNIRLIAIDAPEAHEPGGPEATAMLGDLIRGRQIACDVQYLDRYGRPVAYCSFEKDGARWDLGALMLATGHACRWERYDKDNVYAGAVRQC